MSHWICRRYCLRFLSSPSGYVAVGWLMSHSIVFLTCVWVSKAILSPRERIGAMTFHTSCCLNSIQIPNIWNESLAIFFTCSLGNYEKGFSQTFLILWTRKEHLLWRLLWRNRKKSKNSSDSRLHCLMAGVWNLNSERNMPLLFSWNQLLFKGTLWWNAN